eukprot:1150110-Pelagomonas_calceolata.AAC.2
MQVYHKPVQVVCASLKQYHDMMALHSFTELLNLHRHRIYIWVWDNIHILYTQGSRARSPRVGPSCIAAGPAAADDVVAGAWGIEAVFAAAAAAAAGDSDGSTSAR